MITIKRIIVAVVVDGIERRVHVPASWLRTDLNEVLVASERLGEAHIGEVDEIGLVDFIEEHLAGGGE